MLRTDGGGSPQSLVVVVVVRQMALVCWSVAVLAVVIQTTSSGASPYRRPPSDYRQRLPAILDKRVHDGMLYTQSKMQTIDDV